MSWIVRDGSSAPSVDTRSATRWRNCRKLTFRRASGEPPTFVGAPNVRFQSLNSSMRFAHRAIYAHGILLDTHRSPSRLAASQNQQAGNAQAEYAQVYRLVRTCLGRAG